MSIVLDNMERAEKAAAAAVAAAAASHKVCERPDIEVTRLSSVSSSEVRTHRITWPRSIVGTADLLSTLTMRRR